MGNILLVNGQLSVVRCQLPVLREVVYKVCTLTIPPTGLIPLLLSIFLLPNYANFSIRFLW